MSTTIKPHVGRLPDTKSHIMQGRRRLFKSGTAIKRRRRSPSAEDMSGGRAREGVWPLWLGGFGGSPPLTMLELKMTKEAILLHFETICACETQLILQTL